MDPRRATAGEPAHRPVRSFVRREGRLTPAQARALETLWPRYGVEYSAEALDLDALFGRRAPRTLEIGFGNGETLAALAARHPDRDFLGIEVHRPGVGRLLLACERGSLANVRVICHDAVEVFAAQIPPASLDEVLMLFPDPWPKKRHHKRRLVQTDFVALLAGALKPGGLLRIATDWSDYAEHIGEVLAASPRFARVAVSSALRDETHFERRGRRLGHAIWELAYRREPTPPGLTD